MPLPDKAVNIDTDHIEQIKNYLLNGYLFPILTMAHQSLNDKKTQEVSHKIIKTLGMELDQWTYKSCVAQVGAGGDWATMYFIESTEPGKGHATKLLTFLKAHYENKGLKFGGSVALSDNMRRLYKKLNITEYI